MPNCFCFQDRFTGESVDFNKIDSELCNHFGVEVNEKYFLSLDPRFDNSTAKAPLNWYDAIGFQLACGEKIENMIAEQKSVFEDDFDDSDRQNHSRFVEILEFLEKNYKVKAWAER